ncbi:MAG: CHRD domain-containing protein [Comamonadaceae bacterium]|nr:MAG: CHRD domain-containing protein [Comamonadaceae bacterium]
MKMPGRRLLLLVSALAAAGCSRFFRSGSSDAAAPAPRKDPPDWFMVECSLLPEEVVPRRVGNAGGSMAGTLALTTGQFTWRVNYARLSGPATLAGFYGPAGRGSNGPLAIQLPPHSQAVQHNTGPEAGYELTGSSTLTRAQMAELMAGLWYVSVSTRAWPAGEVRGQMLRSTSGVHGV